MPTESVPSETKGSYVGNELGREEPEPQAETVKTKQANEILKTGRIRRIVPKRVLVGRARATTQSAGERVCLLLFNQGCQP